MVYRVSTLVMSRSRRSPRGTTGLAWRDSRMPSCLAITGVSAPVLVTAEPSEMVTIPVPEHFNLVLVGGSATEAVIRIDVGPTSRPVMTTQLVLQPGDGLKVEDRSTGLVLSDLTVKETEDLITIHRLDIKSDGTIVLDPDTQRPRTTQSQVLKPVTRLVATLTDPRGEPRTLELDLP